MKESRQESSSNSDCLMFVNVFSDHRLPIVICDSAPSNTMWWWMMMPFSFRWLLRPNVCVWAGVLFFNMYLCVHDSLRLWLTYANDAYSMELCNKCIKPEHKNAHTSCYALFIPKYHLNNNPWTIRMIYWINNIKRMIYIYIRLLNSMIHVYYYHEHI